MSDIIQVDQSPVEVLINRDAVEIGVIQVIGSIVPEVLNIIEVQVFS